MVFKVGDKVVYIGYNDYNMYSGLTIGKSYKILSAEFFDIYIIWDDDTSRWVNREYFISKRFYILNNYLNGI